MKQLTIAPALLVVSALIGIPGAQAKEPQPARPLSNPGEWIRPDDYPTAALEAGEEGIVSFEIVVDPKGSVADCQVTVGSGSEELNRRTCELLTVRARFKPAIDAKGDRVVGAFHSRVWWVLPKKIPQPRYVEMTGTFVVEADGTFSNCKVERSTGVAEDRLRDITRFCSGRYTTAPFLDDRGKPVRRTVRMETTTTIEAE